jgi:hypothetical protein
MFALSPSIVVSRRALCRGILGAAIGPVLAVGNRMGNVPERLSWRTRARTPGATHPSTYFFKG